MQHPAMNMQRQPSSSPATGLYTIYKVRRPLSLSCAPVYTQQQSTEHVYNIIIKRCFSARPEMIFSFNRLYPCSLAALSICTLYISPMLVDYMDYYYSCVQYKQQQQSHLEERLPRAGPHIPLFLSFLLLITNNRPLWLYSAAFRPSLSLSLY